MKRYVSWENVQEFIDYISEDMKNKDFTGVYGLPRGGLVLAVMFSHRMNIPLLASPCKGCLIVDDICDSGESLLHYFRNSSGDSVQDYTIVTMFYKENKLNIEPTYMEKKGTDWIVFPWEE